ncbi:MAG: DUF3299 domain-containing protein, partial [Methylomicrobium sp.]|nr:DUF3299 domain-containing protein [Methylomicrobium sp.]
MKIVHTLLKLILCLALAMPVLSVSADNYKTLEWTDLMPQSDLDALMNGPEITHDTPEIPLDSQISNQVRQAIEQAADSAYQKALISTDVKPELNDTKVRIPGFMVPLEFDDEQRVTEFFVVPYFGACIHVPPPPPNQLIHVVYPKGFKLEDLYMPFWFQGVLKTELFSKDVGTGKA